MCFVSAMAANLRGDVNLSLNACTTASSGEAGEGSFADEMHQALLDEGKDESRVVGHYSAGHTTGNSDVRVFEQGLESKQTGAEDQELFFDRCFSDADIQTAADDYGVTVEKAHQKLRKWYRKYLSFWRKNSNKEDRFDVGFVIMMEPDRAVAILRDAWQQASGFKDYSPRPHIDMQTLGRDDADTRRLEEQEQSAAGVDVINGLTVID